MTKDQINKIEKDSMEVAALSFKYALNGCLDKVIENIDIATNYPETTKEEAVESLIDVDCDTFSDAIVEQESEEGFKRVLAIHIISMIAIMRFKFDDQDC